MRVIGIDPGLRELGWAVLEITQKKGAFRLKLLDFGVIITNGEGENSVEERISQIGAELGRVFRKWRPELCGIESPFVWRDPSAALKLGMVVGTGIEIARRHSSEVVLLSPLYIKSKITGNQHADKEEVKAKIKKLLEKADRGKNKKRKKGEKNNSRRKRMSKFQNIKGVPHHVTDAISTAVSAVMKKSGKAIKQKKRDNKKTS